MFTIITQCGMIRSIEENAMIIIGWCKYGHTAELRDSDVCEHCKKHGPPSRLSRSGPWFGILLLAILLIPAIIRTCHE